MDGPGYTIRGANSEDGIRRQSRALRKISGTRGRGGKYSEKQPRHPKDRSAGAAIVQDAMLATPTRSVLVCGEQTRLHARSRHGMRKIQGRL